MNSFFQIIKDKYDYWSNHQGFRRYFANTVWLFFEKFFKIFLGIFIGVWVVRYLGPKQFGLFSYVQSFVAMFGGIATLGLEEIVTRKLIQNGDKKDVLLGTSFVLKIFGALLSLIAIVIAIIINSNDNYTNFLILIIAFVPIFQSFNVIGFYFNSKVLSKNVAIANTVSFIFSNLLKIVFILTKAPLINFVFLIVFENILIVLGYTFFYYKKKLSFKTWKFNKKFAFSFLKYSWPIFGYGILSDIQANIDRIMLKNMLGCDEVAYYSVAFNLMAFFVVIPCVIQNSLLPAIIQAKKKNLNFYKFRMLNLYRMILFLAIIFNLFIFFGGEYIVVTLYGETYRNAGVLFSFFCFRLFIAYFGVIRGFFFINENLQKYTLFTLFVSTTLTILLNYILIPYYGMYGALISSCVSLSISYFFIDFLYPKTRDNFKMMIYSFFTFWKLRI